MRRAVGIQWPVVPPGMWGPLDETGTWSVVYQVGAVESRRDIYGPDHPYDEWQFVTEDEAFAFAMGLDYGIRLFYDEVGLQENIDPDLVGEELGEAPTTEQVEAFADGVAAADGWSEVMYATLDPTENFLLSLDWHDSLRILWRLLGEVPYSLRRKPIEFEEMFVLGRVVENTMARKAAMLWNLPEGEAAQVVFEIPFHYQFYAYVKALASGLRM